MNKIVGFFISVTLVVLATPGAKASMLTECGTYQVEGYYTELDSPRNSKFKQKVILINRGSNSEIIFTIQNANVESLLPNSLINTNLKLQLKFRAKCDYQCTGYVEKLIEALDPFQRPLSFQPSRAAPIKGTKMKCSNN